MSSRRSGKGKAFGFLDFFDEEELVEMEPPTVSAPIVYRALLDGAIALGEFAVGANKWVVTSFRGLQLSKWLSLQGHPRAVMDELVARKWIVRMNEEPRESVDDDVFRLSQHHWPYALNLTCACAEQQPLDALALARDLYMRVHSLDPAADDYQESLERFEEQALQLQVAEMSKIVANEKRLLEFFLNVHATLRRHAKLRWGEKQYLSVLPAASYCIGQHGVTVSVRDIVTGILRGNRPHPWDPSTCAFPDADDVRRKWVCSMLEGDPRLLLVIHEDYKEPFQWDVNLEERLQSGAQSMLQRCIAVRRGSLVLPVVPFHLFRSDFGEEPSELIAWINGVGQTSYDKNKLKVKPADPHSVAAEIHSFYPSYDPLDLLPSSRGKESQPLCLTPLNELAMREYVTAVQRDNEAIRDILAEREALMVQLQADLEHAEEELSVDTTLLTGVAGVEKAWKQQVQGLAGYSIDVGEQLWNIREQVRERLRWIEEKMTQEDRAERRVPQLTSISSPRANVKQQRGIRSGRLLRKKKSGVLGQTHEYLVQTLSMRVPPIDDEVTLPNSSPRITEEFQAHLARAVADLAIGDRYGKVVDELLNSEREYFTDLGTLDRLYIKPLLAESAKKAPMITKRDVGEIFTNFNDIFKLNLQFLRKLEVEHRKEHKSQDFGSLFLESAASFKVYAIYCANTGNAKKRLEALGRSNKKFAEFLRKASSHPAHKGLNTSSFLIKPLQRLCQYPLLLRELLDSLSVVNDTDNPTYRRLQMALKVMNETVESVNATLKSIKKRKELLRLDGLLNWSSVPSDLVKVGRFYSAHNTFRVTVAPHTSPDAPNVSKRDAPKSFSWDVYLLSDVLLLGEISSKGDKMVLRMWVPLEKAVLANLSSSAHSIGKTRSKMRKSSTSAKSRTAPFRADAANADAGFSLWTPDAQVNFAHGDKQVVAVWVKKLKKKIAATKQAHAKLQPPDPQEMLSPIASEAVSDEDEESQGSSKSSRSSRGSSRRGSLLGQEGRSSRSSLRSDDSSHDNDKYGVE